MMHVASITPVNDSVKISVNSSMYSSSLILTTMSLSLYSEDDVYMIPPGQGEPSSS